jgi:hypothetical protein
MLKLIKNASGEQLQRISGVIGVVMIIIAGLLVIAAAPQARDSVVPLVSVGATAISALTQRQQPPAAVPPVAATNGQKGNFHSSGG